MIGDLWEINDEHFDCEVGVIIAIDDKCVTFLTTKDIVTYNIYALNFLVPILTKEER